MTEFHKSIKEAERLRSQLSELRLDSSLDGLITYYEAMHEVADRQHNMYNRLRLMGDPESVQTADEMIHVAEQYMGKTDNNTMDSFFKNMKEEIQKELQILKQEKGGNYDG